jgi:hypothetical protein
VFSNWGFIIYIWKCYKETFYVAVLNKQKCLFFFIYKIGENGGRADPVLGVGTSERQKKVRKGYGRVNIVMNYRNDP